MMTQIPAEEKEKEEEVEENEGYVRGRGRWDEVKRGLVVCW